MSKVAIQGNASGTGTFTIAAPNSNTDRTLTLPDEAGTVLTSASDIPSSQITGSLGITEADYYHLPANVTTTTNPLTTWARQTSFGTGMTYSSGIFTFPSTGYWLIEVTATHRSVSTGTNELDIQVATDGVSFTTKSRALLELNATGGQGDVTTSARYLFDVTDTSTHKAKTTFYRTSTSSIVFGNTVGATTLTFTRLGDT